MDISSGLSLTEPQIKDWHRAIRNGERATLIKYQSRMQCWPFDFAEHRDELFIASLCKRGLPSMRWIAAQIRPSSVVLRAALSRLAHPEFIELIGQNFWPADESTARGHWRYHSVRHILRNHPMGWREGVKNILSAIDAGMPASTTRQYGHGFDLFSDLINTNNKKWNASEAGGVGALSLLLEGISVPEWGSLSEPPMEHVLNTAILAENAEAFFVLLSKTSTPISSVFLDPVMAMVLSGRSYTRAFERGLPPNATIEQIEQLFHRLPPDATIEQIEQLFHHCSATAKPKILIALKKKQSAGYDIEDLIAAVERLILMDMPPSSSIKVRNSCARL